jgi:hypothetical protein
MQRLGPGGWHVQQRSRRRIRVLEVHFIPPVVPAEDSTELPFVTRVSRASILARKSRFCSARRLFCFWKAAAPTRSESRGSSEFSLRRRPRGSDQNRVRLTPPIVVELSGFLYTNQADASRQNALVPFPEKHPRADPRNACALLLIAIFLINRLPPRCSENGKNRSHLLIFAFTNRAGQDRRRSACGQSFCKRPRTSRGVGRLPFTTKAVRSCNHISPIPPLTGASFCD